MARGRPLAHSASPHSWLAAVTITAAVTCCFAHRSHAHAKCLARLATIWPQITICRLIHLSPSSISRDTRPVASFSVTLALCNATDCPTTQFSPCVCVPGRCTTLPSEKRYLAHRSCHQLILIRNRNLPVTLLLAQTVTLTPRTGPHFGPSL